MPNFQRAGVYVTETLAGPSAAPQSTSPSVAGFVGEHWRGPTTYAIQCNSWSDFVLYYGGFNPNQTPALKNAYLAHAVYQYFANGGQSCWITRVPNTSATTSGVAAASASAILVDNSTTSQTALTLAAGIRGVVGSPGTWGNNLYYTVSVGSAAGRFNITIYYGGNTPQYAVESWADMSLTPSDPRYVLTVMNSLISGSAYVTVSLGTGTAVKTVATVTSFTGGLDGTASSVYVGPNATDFTSVLTFGGITPGFVASPFDIVPGVLNINLPGVSDAPSLAPALAYVGGSSPRPYSFLVIDTPPAQTPLNAAAFPATVGGSLSTSSYAAVYYPWLNVANPASTSLQSTILVPPGGPVLGQMVTTDASSGTWVTPAGLTTVLSNVVQAERPLSPSDLNTLNTSNVNALRTLPSGQVVIWGGRTLNASYASMYVPIRRTLNYLESTLSSRLLSLVFQPNDALLWSRASAICNGFLGGMYSANAFPGTTVATSYYVICNATNNTPASTAQGVLNVTVGVALNYPAEFISLTISQFQNNGGNTASPSTTTV